MKAVYIQAYGDVDVLEIGERPNPKPKPNQVLIDVHAASINPRDYLLRKGRYQFRKLLGDFPIVLGSDVAGVVAQAGSKVKDLKVGDEVYAMQTMFGRMGAYAEQICIKETAVSPKPQNLSMVEASALPLGVLTAYRALHYDGNLRTGDQVLIIGASGSVGLNAVQLAKVHGAKVTGICSGKNKQMVLNHGADRVIDYTAQDWREDLQVYDLILDCVGKTGFAICSRRLSSRGTHVTCIPNGRGVWDRFRTALIPGRNSKMVLVQADGSILNLARVLAESGNLKPVIDKVYAMEDVAEAHRYAQSFHTAGKLVIKIR